MKFALLAIPVFGLFAWSQSPPTRLSGSVPVTTRLSSPASLAECQIAHEWAKSHSWMLPTTVDALIAYPVLYQRAIFANVPAPTRSKLWREHLRKFYSPASRLSPSQQGFVKAVSDNLDQIFAAPVSDDWLRQFGDQAIAVLGRRAAITVFGSLGTDDPELLDLAMLGRDAYASPSSQLRGRATSNVYLTGFRSYRSDASPASAVSSLSCHCNLSADFCDTITGPQEECKPIQCEPYEPGCGWFWQQECNGRCNYVAPLPPPE